MTRLPRPGAALLLCCLTASALAGPNEDFHTWATALATGTVGADGSPYRYWIEGQGRYDDDSSHLNQSLLRGALGYALAPRLVAWAGYAHVNNDPQGTDEDVTEHRYWQQLTWNRATPLAGLDLATRTRLEERTVESFGDTGWRFRQLVKLSRPLGDGSRLYLAAWDEVFVNFNDADWGAQDGFDQNRAFAGLGIKLAPWARSEIGYMNQYVRRTGRADAMNHIASVTLFLNF
ncbi:MAG: DUF2490 domain-containing protein [Gammaproteobacteria bacterium]